jgi:predicted nucleotidyltransferase
MPVPVRSLNSSVLVWPDRATVDRAVRAWAQRVAEERPDVVRLGYFGSYARGDWGVGSDLDLVAIVRRSDRPFQERGLDWDLTRLPVPSVILVDEWDGLRRHRTRFCSHSDARDNVGDRLADGLNRCSECRCGRLSSP